MWSLVRSCCRDLLDPEELERYQELYNRDDDESRQSEWESLIGMFDEVSAAAGRDRGDDDDDNDDNDDDDDDDDDDNDDDNDDSNQKPLGEGIILVPRAERQRDHRGMMSVTTTIGNRKRKATGGPAI